ncbi:MAG: glycosyltransferase, partial [Proteobacteria bacterium]|nr:glycosyltransferase [Pseudomonadota bacterium]
MPLKVCHVLTRLILGGADENTLLTACHADRSRFEVSLAYGAECDDAHLRTAHEHGVNTRQFPRLINRPAPVLDTMVIREMAGWMRDEGFHIVHTHQTKGGFVGRVAAHLAGVPIIIHTVHGWGFGSLDIWWLDAVLRSFERFTARWCDAIFFVCDNLRRQAIEMRIGRPEIFKTVYSGIVLERYIEPSRRAQRQPDSPLVVATIT